MSRIRVEINWERWGLTESSRARLRKQVREGLERTGKLGLSASGASLSFAVEWYEERAQPYRIVAMPGLGYSLETFDRDAKLAATNAPERAALGWRRVRCVVELPVRGEGYSETDLRHDVELGLDQTRMIRASRGVQKGRLLVKGYERMMRSLRGGRANV